MAPYRLRFTLALLAGTAAAMAVGSAEAQRGPASSQDVVVTGTRSRMSSWREAETSHVIVQSDGTESDLIRITRNLERLHFLLNGLMARTDAGDDPLRIRVTLIGDVAAFQNMGLKNWRWQQGPFNDRFQIGRYYDPREDGAVMASTRADQRVVIEHTTLNAESVASLTTSLARSGGFANSAPSDPGLTAAMIGSIGNIATAGMRSDNEVGPTFGEKAIQLSAESLLYAGYAQHYLLTYFPAAYPRWYLDGFGQIFASFATPKENVVEFGRVPSGTTAVLHEFGSYPVKKVLDDTYLTENLHKSGWTPVHAWMLTHFLFFSDTRRPQLRQYLAARANGADAATAAAVFGDQAKLAAELRAYHAGRKPYIQVNYDGSKIEQPLVRRLRESEAAFVQGRLELGARVTIPPLPPAEATAAQAKTMTKAREEAIAARDRWLVRLRRDAIKYPRDFGAQLLLAEAECRSGSPVAGLAAATAAETLVPGDARALAWKGLAMAQQAAAQPAADRPLMLAAARALIVKANHADSDAVRPLLAYYASFAVAGEQPSVSAIDGLQRALEEVPSAPGTRLEFATALADRGNKDAARKVILPVAVGAYDTPEKPAAIALLRRMEQPSTAAEATPQTQLSADGARKNPG